MTRNHAYMGDYTVLTELIYGPKIYVDTRDLSMSGHIIMSGFWEKWVTDVFRATVRPGMTVCDIGSHCGYFALIAAQLVGASGKVHCFEPNPLLHDNLFKSKMINGFYHMEIHPVAVADRDKEETLFVPHHLAASASLSEKVAESVAAIDPVKPVKVRAINLENYLGDVLVDVLKVDIEGYEPYVLPSLLNMMDRVNHPRMFMEFNPKAWTDQGFNCLQLLRGITDRGYRIDIIRHDSTLSSASPDELLASPTVHTHFDLLISRNQEGLFESRKGDQAS